MQEEVEKKKTPITKRRRGHIIRFLEKLEKKKTQQLVAEMKILRGEERK